MAKHSIRPRKSYIINPRPETGTPVETQGLRVVFTEDDFVALRPVANPSLAFCIGPEAALQLAELIAKEILTGRFSIAVNLEPDGDTPSDTPATSDSAETA